MSINRNSKPKMLTSEDSTSIVDTGHTLRPSTPDPECSICLDDLKNKCHTNGCMHSFCYECLKRWSNTAHFCPLCKKNFSCIHHSFNNFGIFETYDVPLPLSTREDEMLDDEIPDEIIVISEDVIMVSTMRGIFGENGLGSNPDGVGQIRRIPTINTPIIGQSRRTEVYVTNVWAEPLLDRAIHISDITSVFYRDNPAQTNRLQLFVLRDVVAIRNSQISNGHYRYSPINTDINISNLIMQSLITYEIRDLHMLTFVRDFMNEHARHFCHELYNFANSSFDIFNYDFNVQYTHRPHEPNIEEISYNTDDYDIEILSHSSGSIESLNFPSTDQPSTSTGIRHPLNWPNNRFQSVNNSMFARNHSSSDDENSIVSKNQSKFDYSFPQFFPVDNVGNGNKKTKKRTTKKKKRDPNIAGVNEISNNTDDSDIEILSLSASSFESLNFLSIDQPSTSTGIQHSLNRSNNRFQSVNNSMFSRNHFSSDDENLIVSTRDSQIALTESQDVKDKSGITNQSKFDYSFPQFFPVDNVANDTKKTKKRTTEKKKRDPNIVEINGISNNTDDSDIEILSLSSSSIESLNFPSTDQPSTSTGILHSLNRPNNRFQSVNNSMFSRNHFSSDDENLIVSTRDSQIALTESQDVMDKSDITNQSKFVYSFPQFFPVDNVGNDTKKTKKRTEKKKRDPNIVEINGISNNTDDSDIEILSLSSSSIESLNFPSIDQPSTSTGIRHPLNRPNNRFLSVNNSMFSRNHSSSDDENSIVSTRDSQIDLTESQDVKDKSDIKNQSKFDYSFPQIFPVDNDGNGNKKNKQKKNKRAKK